MLSSTAGRQLFKMHQFKEINERSNKIQFVDDEKAKIYGNVMGKTIQSLKSHERGAGLYTDITDKPKYNFKVGGKILDEASLQTEVCADMIKDANFNFTPYAMQSSNLVLHSTEEVSKFNLKRKNSFEGNYK